MNAKLTRTVLDDNRIWFTDHRYAALFCYDLEKGECELLTYLKSEDLLQNDEMTVAARYGEKIVIVPVQGNEVMVYDLDKRTLRCYQINRKTEGVGYCSAVITDRLLWITPCRERNIICFDMEKESVMYFGDADIPFNDEGEENFGYAVYAEHSIWMPCVFANMVIEFDTDKRVFRKHTIEIDGCMCGVICYCNEKFYILNIKNNSLVEWIPGGDAKELCETPFLAGEREATFKAHKHGEDIIFMPRNTDGIWVFHSRYKKWRKIADKLMVSSLYEEAVIVGNKVYGFDLGEGIHFVWDHDTDEVEFFEIEYPKSVERLLTGMNFSYRIKNNMPVTYLESECELSVFLMALSKWRRES